jgi:(E)-4-hydroxy-3-methylbut-2-enyl-diphosphate synthase
MPYCSNPFSYQRRISREVKVGELGVGGANPIRVQSMTISDTLNTDAVVKEAIGLIEVGCEIVRITAPTIHHAENLKNIRAELRSKGYRTPLVADIHFTPQAAMIAADYVEKVRVNPGNYADRKLFAVKEYTDAQYESELKRIEEKFAPLVIKCRDRGVAMRIGTNHGSLSDRIMNRYGDTPLGMVESALEFVRICRANDYHDIILSMKASNPQVMVQAYRMLVDRMYQEGMDYPLHLGVTEAGEGEDGRIKSAVGILTLLEDGIGDTVRVSLTEDSIHEIPVAQAMVRPFNDRGGAAMTRPPREGHDTAMPPQTSWNPFEYTRQPCETVALGPTYVGGKHVVRVQVSRDWNDDPQLLSQWESEILKLTQQERLPEIVSFRLTQTESPEAADSFLEYAGTFKKKFPKIALGVDLSDAAHLFPKVAPAVHKVSVAPSREKNREGWKAQAIEIVRIAKQLPLGLEWKLSDEVLPSFAPKGFRTSLLMELAEWTKAEGLERFGISWAGSDWIYENRFLANQVQLNRLECAIHLSPIVTLPLAPFLEGRGWGGGDSEDSLLYLTGQIGCLLLDGIGDSIEAPTVRATHASPLQASVHLSYNILQAARQRVTKTEFIACPSCGRTLFDLQTTTARIKKITSHLKGVKIAIMGCIVNGPGEMADADFGYVGGGPQSHPPLCKECVEKASLKKKPTSVGGPHQETRQVGRTSFRGRSLRMSDKLSFFILFFPAFLFALAFHESAHGLVALRLGDDTAKRLGRITLNPIPHMDLIGTVILPLVLFFSPGIRVPIGGWAKPVPVDLRNFKNPRQDNLWVALAGPVSNLILALICAGLLWALVLGVPSLGGLGEKSFFHSAFGVIYGLLEVSIWINLGLAVFNLIPLHPLDGGKVVMGILPESWVGAYNRIAIYGILIVFILFYVGAFRYLFIPVKYLAELLIPG